MQWLKTKTLIKIQNVNLTCISSDDCGPLGWMVTWGTWDEVFSWVLPHGTWINIIPFEFPDVAGICCMVCTGINMTGALAVSIWFIDTGAIITGLPPWTTAGCGIGWLPVGTAWAWKLRWSWPKHAKCYNKSSNIQTNNLSWTLSVFCDGERASV